jgi:PLP dependent protein
MLKSRPMPEGHEFIAENLPSIKERIAAATARAGRAKDEITLVAISKTFLAEAVREAYAEGIRHFGENRVQEFEAKHAALRDLQAVWHFIGHLQSNKARRAVQLFNRIDSVDSVALAHKLDAAAGEAEKILPVLIEVHLGEEETKSGVDEQQLPRLAEAICALPHLSLRGLMAIPPYTDNVEDVRSYFRALRNLHSATSSLIGRQLPVLSMGMSRDFEVAIEEGATEVRVGTALFGERRTADRSNPTT